MKIFQIGFNKCGTTSFYNLFKGSGYNCAHYWVEVNLLSSKKDIRPTEIYYFNGVKDSRKYILLADLFEYNKENDLPLLHGLNDDIILYGDMENAEKNIYSHVSDFKLLDQQYPNSKFILNTRSMEKWVESRNNHPEYLSTCMNNYKCTALEVFKHWKKEWINHHKNVTDYFAGRDNLLMFNLETDSFEKIASFLPELNLNKDMWFKANKSI